MDTKYLKNSEEGKAQKHNQGKHQVTSQLIGDMRNQLSFESKKHDQDKKKFEREESKTEVFTVSLKSEGFR